MSKDMNTDLNEIDDIQVLKDMLNSLRMELEQKDQEMKSLEATINELVSELKKYKNLEKKYDTQQDTAALKTMQGYVVELENKVYHLNEQISKLEKERNTFIQKNEKITTEEEYTSTLENKIVEYDEKIDNLEKVNKLHRDTIDKLRAEHSSMVTNLENKIKEQNDYVASLVKENRELKKTNEIAKIEKHEGDIEGNVIRLQKEIAVLKKENKELNEKNQVLKAALLLHVDVETTELTDTIIHPAMLSQKQSPIKVSEEIIKQKIDTKEIEQFADVPKGMVQDLVKKRHEAIETREIPKNFPESIVESPKTTKETLGEQISKEQEAPIPTPEKIVPKGLSETAEVSDIDDIGVIETTDGRRKCPICGNENLRQIREVDDKTKIISAYPRMYGKKFKCGQCGAEWR